MLKIKLKFGDKLLKEIEIEKPVVSIGRDVDSNIRIDNLAVSKNHAQILDLQGTYVIEDLDSTNGTLLNDKKIKKETLNHGDVVTIGKHKLEINIRQYSGTAMYQTGIGNKTIKIKKS